MSKIQNSKWGQIFYELSIYHDDISSFIERCELRTEISEQKCVKSQVRLPKEFDQIVAYVHSCSKLSRCFVFFKIFLLI